MQFFASFYNFFRPHKKPQIFRHANSMRAGCACFRQKLEAWMQSE